MSQWTFGQSGRKVDAIQFTNNLQQIEDWLSKRETTARIIGNKNWANYKISIEGVLKYQTEEFDIEYGDYLIYENNKYYKMEESFFKKHYEII